MASLGQLVVEISTDLTNFNKGLADAEKKVRDTTGKISALANKVGVGLTVVGAAITGAFALMIKSSVDYADEIYNVSQRTGIATETLSKLKYVAEQTESSFEGLTTGLRILSKNIYDAYTGGARTNETFRELGISVTDANGKMVSAEDTLMAIADRFRTIEDATAKSALALQLFGRGGSSLIPVLNLGSEGIKKLSDEAERLGIVLTSENAIAIDKFSDNMKSMKASISGLWLNITQMLIPALNDLIKKVTDITVAIRQWSEAHPALSKFITEITLALGVLALAFGPIIILINQFLQTALLLKLALPAVTLNVGALTTAFGFLWAAMWPVIALFAGWKLGEWIENNSPKIKQFGYELKQMADDFKKFITGRSSGPVMEFGWGETKAPEVPGVAATPTPAPDITELDTTLAKLQQHAEAIKVLNEQYISGKINAEQYLTSARTLWQDGIDLAKQKKDILDQELNLELLLTDTQTQKAFIENEHMSEKISLAQQSLELMDLEIDAEQRRLDVMQQGLSIVQGYYSAKAQLENQDLMNQQSTITAATQLLQTAASMHQSLWAGIYGLMNTTVKSFSQGLSTAISSIILGTQSASQAFKQLGSTMIATLVNYIIEWGIQNLIAIALGWVLIKANILQAAAVASAWATAAAFVSLATLGANAIPASAAIVGVTGLAITMAAISAAAAIPMAEGGIGTVTQPTLFLAGEKGKEDFAFSPASKGGISAGGDTYNTFDITIENPVIKNDMDIEELAEQLGENIQRKLRRVS